TPSADLGLHHPRNRRAKNDSRHLSQSPPGSNYPSGLRRILSQANCPLAPGLDSALGAVPPYTPAAVSSNESEHRSAAGMSRNLLPHRPCHHVGIKIIDAHPGID